MAVPSFTIDATIRQLYQDNIDTLIDQLGVDCKLILDGARLPCPNCYFDSVQSRSTGQYNGTGPIPFQHPPCPVCNGTGYDPTATTTEEVRHFSIRRNLKPSTVGLVLPETMLTRPSLVARIKGLVTDMALVKQAKYFILDYQHAIYSNERYKPINEPTFTGNIVSGRYFIQYLIRED